MGLIEMIINLNGHRGLLVKLDIAKSSLLYADVEIISSSIEAYEVTILLTDNSTKVTLVADISEVLRALKYAQCG